MSSHFPLDGSRLWEYLSDADDVNWTLEVEKTKTATASTYEVITLEHLNGDTVESLFDVEWSSDSTNGVKIHGYEDYASGSGPVSFSPAVQFASRQMVPGDISVTEVGGTTFTATFEGLTSCATHWAVDWDELDCLVVTVKAADGNHTPITGRYTIVPRYGAAYLDLDYYDDLWNLADHTWSAD
jgi:hypothetical protein